MGSPVMPAGPIPVPRPDGVAGAPPLALTTPGGRTEVGPARVGQRDARRGPILLALLALARPSAPLLIVRSRRARSPLPGQIGHLQPKAQRGKSLHEDLALIGGNGGNVHGPLGKDQCEALVRVGRLALLPEDGSAGEHRVERIGTPRVPYLLTGAEVELRGSLRGGGLSQRRLPREGSAVGVDVQDAEAGLAPPGPAVLDDGDAGAESGDEAPDDEVGRVGASGGGLEGGEVHGHADLVGLGGRLGGEGGDGLAREGDRAAGAVSS
mmetsp:Transcript_14215/g.26913  ORF Transcript_14215/g.26913 Transcript_14215/m.26913 type:complete len:267 (+) Transcript_14215:356-1156(+)